MWIDVLRVASVAVVVVGHWVTTTVIWETDRIGIENALSVVSESHLVTWLIQVMPVMFFVGGFSNFRSFDRHERMYLAFLRTRLTRLLAPTLVFIGIWTVVGLASQLSGADLPNIVDRAADLAALPFWFLGLYLVVVALTPAMVALHRRFGWRAAAAMAVGAGVVDIVHHGLGVPGVGVINFAFVWLLAHQLGFLYADASLLRLPRRVVAVAAVISLVVLVLLTTVGDYPVSMVGVPGEERWNTNPPSFALVALSVLIIGLELLIRSPLQRLASRRRQGIQRVNSEVLTVFLWHVSALAIFAAVAYPLGLPKPETGTSDWWIQRPIWVVGAGAVLWVLTTLLGRFEVHPQPRPAPGMTTATGGAAAMAVALVSFGILGFGVTGFNRPTHSLGEDLLGLELNPLMNLLHLAGGILLLYALYSGSRSRRIAVLATIAVGFVVLGAIGTGGIDVLGTNTSTAVVHVVIGVLGLAAVVWSTAESAHG